jgi:hypothetical protein
MRGGERLGGVGARHYIRKESKRLNVGLKSMLKAQESRRAEPVIYILNNKNRPLGWCVDVMCAAAACG